MPTHILLIYPPTYWYDICVCVRRPVILYWIDLHTFAVQILSPVIPVHTNNFLRAPERHQNSHSMFRHPSLSTFSCRASYPSTQEILGNSSRASHFEAITPTRRVTCTALHCLLHLFFIHHGNSPCKNKILKITISQNTILKEFF